MRWKSSTYPAVNVCLSISITSIIAYDQLTADVYDNNETFFKGWYPYRYAYILFSNNGRWFETVNRHLIFCMACIVGRGIWFRQNGYPTVSNKAGEFIISIILTRIICL